MCHVTASGLLGIRHELVASDRTRIRSADAVELAAGEGAARQPLGPF